MHVVCDMSAMELQSIARLTGRAAVGVISPTSAQWAAAMGVK